MHIFSNLEYSFIIGELGPKLVGRHLRKIKKISDKTYRIRVGDEDILCELGVRLHSTKYIEASELTDKFVEKASKELDNAKLISLEQINSDRIVLLQFDRGRALIFEMFGDGNIIFIKDGKIVAAVKYEKWSDREIKAGSAYMPPKPSVAQRLEPSDKYVIVSLMKLPFGKDYAQEALARLKISEKTPGNQLPAGQIREIENELAKIKNSAKALVFYDGGKPVDFSLAQLSKYSGLQTREFATLGEAADEYYSHFVASDPKIEKLHKRLEKQEERLAELEAEEKSLKEKGDFIYNNYEKASEIIELAKNSKFEEIETKFKGKINKKDKSVEVEL